MEKKKWLGTNPSGMNCDGCLIQFENAFSDVATRNGLWGNFCDKCLPLVVWDRSSCYGTGKGQRYEKEGKDWVKVAG